MIAIPVAHSRLDHASLTLRQRLLSLRQRWAYVAEDGERDLRIDFLRGVVMVVLITVHIELFSVFNLFTFERFGCISGGEGFVILSGVVLGRAYGRRVRAGAPWTDTTWKLLERAAQLYRVSVALIAIVWLVRLSGWVDVSAITSFIDRANDKVYPLYPALGASWNAVAGSMAVLRSGPHQVQVLGLYVILIAFVPLALYIMNQGKTSGILAMSWIVYLYNTAYPAMPTGAQFEYGFPVLTWQLIFFHGVAVGYHWKALMDFAATPRGRIAVAGCVALACAFAFFAQNTTNANMPTWARISVIPPDVFNDIYRRFFQKNTLGVLRVVNYAVALVTAMVALTVAWVPLRRWLGWFLIPIGQCTLYVFILHLFVVAFINIIIPFKISISHDDIWLNTAAHAAALAFLWAMVRWRVAFGFIPR